MRGKEGGATVCSPGGVGCNYRERSKWGRRGDVSGNVIFHFNGGLFCLLRFLGLFYRPLDPSLISFICFSCLLRRRFYCSPFIRGPVLVPPSLRLALLIPVTAASSSCSCRLDSFLLSWRERLNSLRPLFAPDSLSSFLGLVATSRPPTAETVASEMHVSHSCFRLEFLIVFTSCEEIQQNNTITRW